MVGTFTLFLHFFFFQFLGNISRFCPRSVEQYTETDLDQVSISCPQYSPLHCALAVFYIVPNIACYVASSYVATAAEMWNVTMHCNTL